MKSTLKRFLSLVLCMCMVMALLPNVTMTAFAATRCLVGQWYEHYRRSYQHGWNMQRYIL